MKIVENKIVDFYYVDFDLRYIEYFRKNFDYNSKHCLYTFSSTESFFNKFKDDQEKSNLKIVIVDHFIKDKNKSVWIMEYIGQIKDIDSNTQIIILSDAENMEIKVTKSKLYPNAFVPKNDYTFISLPNTISMLVSKNLLKIHTNKTKRAKIIAAITFSILLLFLLITFLI